MYTCPSITPDSYTREVYTLSCDTGYSKYKREFYPGTGVIGYNCVKNCPEVWRIADLDVQLQVLVGLKC